MADRQIPFSIAVNVKEFLAGVAAEEASKAKDTVKAKAILDSYIKNVELDLRAVYDKYMPNVLVLDVVNTTNLIANRIVKDITSVADKNSDTVAIGAKFGNSSSKEYLGLLQVISETTATYHKSLLAGQTYTDPVAELNNLSERLFNRVRRVENVISARVLGFEFSSAVRKVFGNKAVLAAILPDLSSSTSFVFFSSSFRAVDTIRDRIYTEIVKYLKDVFGPDLKSGFAVGSIVNIGHATLINEVGTYVNSPAFAKSLYSVASGTSSLFSKTQVVEAAKYFKVESKIIENKIEVSKEFTASGKYGTLLSLGVTFTNTEDSVINTSRGRESEGPTARKIGFAKPQNLTNSQRQKIIDKLFRVVLRSNPLLGKSSRNVLEFIRDAVVGELSGKKTKGEKSKVVVSSKFTKTAIVPNDKAKPTKFKTPSVNRVKTSLNSINNKFYDSSLFDLERFIRFNLADTIRRNMGTGSSKSVLNYRTGRFADSVEVKKLTNSRDGMITVFYEYMKNPYATFSSGGKQEQPKSRDPKLLVSKSIRSLAAKMAINKLRAVSV